MRYVLAVLILTTFDFSLSQRQGDPSVCDNATMRHGVGFKPHPTDCSQYIMCFYTSSVIPIYNNCEFGKFWNHAKLRCEPSELVDCIQDKCRTGVTFYKYSDLNNCVAYWKCSQRKAYSECCPEGKGFHPELGCVENANCTDVCPTLDRVPGCNRRPVSGSPTRYMQYTDHGVWRKERCPAGRAYSPVNCECSIDGVIVPGKVCNPDVVIDFNEGIVDKSGNNYRLTNQNVRLHNGAGYFNGNSKLVVEPLRALQTDEGILIIKMRYRERPGNGGLQVMVTNDHCGKKASVMVAKIQDVVLLGSETVSNFSKTFSLPIRWNNQTKPWKEVIYMHDSFQLEGRVCGATDTRYSLNKLRDNQCGFQFGLSGVPNQRTGYVGLLDDISIYRCKPLDTVININY